MSTWNPTNCDPDDSANRRHIGSSPAEMGTMLSAIGVGSLDELINQTVPAGLRQAEPLAQESLMESAVLGELRRIAPRNRIRTSMIGQGYYGTIIPPAIQRNILENPAWYTSYTPYQPEISQGRLKTLLNFQAMINDLIGLKIANASLLDEVTVAAEAMNMAFVAGKRRKSRFFVAADLHLRILSVLATRARPLDIELVIGEVEDLNVDGLFGAIFAYPGTHGHLRSHITRCEILHEAGTLAIMAVDLLALTLLKGSGAMGFDIAIGSTRRFGVPMGFGSSHAAFMTCWDKLKRIMPGRLVGVSKDSAGNRAHRLALRTREQHIRREKTTSNVCTAQALPAVMASLYAVFHGPAGLKAIGQRVHLMAVTLAEHLRAGGAIVEPDEFFDTITVQVGVGQAGIIVAAEQQGINLRRVDRDRVGISVGEATTLETLVSVLDTFGIEPVTKLSRRPAIPDAPLRTSEYLTRPVSHMNRTESEMMHYMRRLTDRDLALDQVMIPLGSCTMKLNTVAEMMPITWPEFAGLHPFAPASQSEGYRELAANLGKLLCEITGYDAFSMQSNSGAQGKYAGLRTIAAHHHVNGNERDVCLIPTSAHDTSPASATMAGMRVVAVKSAKNGDIDLNDFVARAEEVGDRLAAAMITYLSTHDVFGDTVRRVCEITHAHGGQVYIDGVDMNALVGLVRPGDLDGDVSRVNLHKTFAIPHGGGSPGMGSIGVKEHLKPHLSGDPATEEGGAVSAAAFGPISILPISWAYIWLMGGSGLTQAIRVAILNANYLACRLSEAYPILYRGGNGRVAHECIVDTCILTYHGVTVDDSAKRLIDHGFHAPTMSLSAAGTLMVEPTESETSAELDRFVTAMLDIAREADDMASGRIAAEESPLRRAPHTVEDLVADWDRPYSREQGCFPAGTFRANRYWPPAGRVDNAYGSRYLVCSYPAWEGTTA